MNAAECFKADSCLVNSNRPDTQEMDLFSLF